jgi:hypothetical protein
MEGGREKKDEQEVGMRRSCRIIYRVEKATIERNPSKATGPTSAESWARDIGGANDAESHANYGAFRRFLGGAANCQWNPSIFTLQSYSTEYILVA